MKNLNPDITTNSSTRTWCTNRTTSSRKRYKILLQTLYSLPLKFKFKVYFPSRENILQQSNRLRKKSHVTREISSQRIRPFLLHSLNYGVVDLRVDTLRYGKKTVEEGFGGKEAQRIRPRSKGRSRTPSRRPSFFLEEKSPLVSGRDDLENWTFRRGCRVVDWCANRTRGDDDVVLGWVMGFICPHHRRATSSLLSFVEVSPPENRLVSRGNDEKGLEKSRHPWKQGRPILIEVSLGF